MRAQPKGRVLQRSLDTHYVRLDGVIASLSREAFVGYVRAVFERDEALLFFRDGDPVACLLERDGRLTRGLDALTALLAGVKADRAFLDVCRLDHDLLAAVLAVWHGAPADSGGAAPRTAADALAAAARRHLTGALVAEPGGEEILGYCADGEPLGWHRPAADEWSKTAPAGLAPADWTLWHAPEASALRTIDLGRLKEHVMEELRALTARHVPLFGPRLFAVERATQGAQDPRSLGSAAFLALAAGTAARARLLIGPERAEALRAALAERAGTVVDPGA